MVIISTQRQTQGIAKDGGKTFFLIATLLLKMLDERIASFKKTSLVPWVEKNLRAYEILTFRCFSVRGKHENLVEKVFFAVVTCWGGMMDEQLTGHACCSRIARR